jgi:hypothetical protein
MSQQGATPSPYPLPEGEGLGKLETGTHSVHYTPRSDER